MVGELITKLFSARTFEEGSDPWKQSVCEGRGYKISMETGESEWTEDKTLGPHLQHMAQLFEKHDTDESGELEWSEFWSVLNEMGLELSDEEIAEWQQYADADQNGSVKWSEFEPMAEELIKKFYQEHEYTSEEDPWVTMTDLNGASYQLNKKTGEYRNIPTTETTTDETVTE